MTFDEWWAENTHKFEALDQAIDIAKQAWHVAETATREELLTQFNRTGVDIDAALHGRVNEQSPIANRLRMIATAQPEWRSMKSAPKDGRFVLIFDSDYPTVEPIIARYRHGDWWSQPTAAGHSIVWRHATHWMALPPPPEKTK